MLRLNQLSPRYRDVVAQVCLGRTNREIAAALGLTHRTVAIYMERIFEKAGVTSRTQLAIEMAAQVRELGV